LVASYRHWFWLIVMLAVIGFGSAEIADACPTCRQGIANGADHSHLIRGYFWSIVFMMSMPFLILGSLCTYFYLQVQRARAAQAAAVA
jgi:hypothetical protein